ncbi:MAG: hypothetical protein AVDCRST_MAG73-2541, partial [uncultured Thermomicrobiales bacterium]
VRRLGPAGRGPAGVFFLRAPLRGGLASDRRHPPPLAARAGARTARARFPAIRRPRGPFPLQRQQPARLCRLVWRRRLPGAERGRRAVAARLGARRGRGAGGGAAGLLVSRHACRQPRRGTRSGGFSPAGDDRPRHLLDPGRWRRRSRLRARRSPMRLGGAGCARGGNRSRDRGRGGSGRARYGPGRAVGGVRGGAPRRSGPATPRARRGGRLAAARGAPPGKRRDSGGSSGYPSL